nr:putative integron gene cassette protein [uncultured bacterium]
MNSNVRPQRTHGTRFIQMPTVRRSEAIVFRLRPSSPHHRAIGVGGRICVWPVRRNRCGASARCNVPWSRGRGYTPGYVAAAQVSTLRGTWP